VVFKAEELTTKVFPLLAAGGCPQDTVTKGRPPCPQNTHAPCPENTHPPCGAGTDNCPQDTAPTTGPGHGKKSVSGLQGSDLKLLRAQLHDRLRQGPEASL
jgi:hypothetical protein